MLPRFYASLRWGTRPLSTSGLSTTRNFEAERLAAHLWQQVVDERAPEHVEKTGSNPTIDA
jgi:hypothetical protein